MSIAENLKSLEQIIRPTARLVAVSKMHDVQTIMEAYDAGQRIFGENKAQELTSKAPALPGDIEWHFIGHLQRNKVKAIIPYVDTIHSIDSLRLLKEINKEAGKAGKTIKCLLQFHIAEEDTKFGLDLQEAKEILQSDQFKQMQHIAIHGLMGMATFTDNKDQVRREFRMLKSIFDSLKGDFFADQEEFSEISMGMSNDFKIALEEGATLLRIGTTVFGERNYSQA